MKETCADSPTLAFRLAGWRTEGALPPDARFVLIAAPHTSNWDAVILLVAARIFRLPLAWFVKDSWFFFPMGPMMRRARRRADRPQRAPRSRSSRPSSA